MAYVQKEIPWLKEFPYVLTESYSRVQLITAVHLRYSAREIVSKF